MVQPKSGCHLEMKNLRRLKTLMPKLWCLQKRIPILLIILILAVLVHLIWILLIYVRIIRVKLILMMLNPQRMNLKILFKNAGEVVEVHLLTNEVEVFRGFGHVKFAADSSCKEEACCQICSSNSYAEENN
ncbi:uncharacterized protein LOC112488890 isoform X2 [Ziziphus jujuba]|uniref:Uncharacterized protein LOC112488890 isoform X2 n=1 Tax=Ziziphus jujuba TaxID=326968 RepID=A0ABM3ZVP8_ZIZJJ|nr:uncharacterized protein LOC112488890 isoform X2 [Ziziphus jujuba]